MRDLLIIVGALLLVTSNICNGIDVSANLKLGGCPLSMSTQHGRVTIRSLCSGGAPLTPLLGYFLTEDDSDLTRSLPNGINFDMSEMTGGFFDPDNFDFMKAEKEGKEFTFAGRAKSVIKFGDGNFVMASVELQEFKLVEGLGWPAVQVTGSGMVEFNGKPVKASLKKTNGSELLEVKISKESFAAAGDVSLGRLSQTFRADFNKIGLQQIDPNLKAEDIKETCISEATLDGKLGLDESMYLSFDGVSKCPKAANLGIDGSNVHLVINQAEDENPRVGVQFTVKDKTMDDVFGSINNVKKGSFNFPLLGKMKNKMKLSFGEEDLTGSTIMEGLMNEFEIDVSAMKENCPAVAENALKLLKFRMQKDDDGWYTLAVPEGFNAKLKGFIRCFTNDKMYELPESIFGNGEQDKEPVDGASDATKRDGEEGEEGDDEDEDKKIDPIFEIKEIYYKPKEEPVDDPVVGAGGRRKRETAGEEDEAFDDYTASEVDESADAGNLFEVDVDTTSDGSGDQEENSGSGSGEASEKRDHIQRKQKAVHKKRSDQAGGTEPNAAQRAGKAAFDKIMEIKDNTEGFGISLKIAEITCLFDKLKFTDVEVSIIKDGLDWKFEGGASIKKTIIKEKVETELEIRKDGGDGEREKVETELEIRLEIAKSTKNESDYKFLIEIPSLTFLDICDWVGAEISVNKSSSLALWGVKNFKMELSRSDMSTDFRMMGSPLLMGLELQMEVQVWGSKDESQAKRTPPKKVTRKAHLPVPKRVVNAKSTSRDVVQMARDKYRSVARKRRSSPNDATAAAVKAAVASAAPEPAPRTPKTKKTKEKKKWQWPDLNPLNKNIVFAIGVDGVNLNDIMEFITGNKTAVTWIKDMKAYIMLSNTDQNPPVSEEEEDDDNDKETDGAEKVDGEEEAAADETEEDLSKSKKKIQKAVKVVDKVAKASRGQNGMKNVKSGAELEKDLKKQRVIERKKAPKRVQQIKQQLKNETKKTRRSTEEESDDAETAKLLTAEMRSSLQSETSAPVGSPDAPELDDNVAETAEEAAGEVDQSSLTPEQRDLDDALESMKDYREQLTSLGQSRSSIDVMGHTRASSLTIAAKKRKSGSRLRKAKRKAKALKKAKRDKKKKDGTAEEKEEAKEEEEEEEKANGLELSLLKDAVIKPGITLYAELNTPAVDDCEKDETCIWIANVNENKSMKAYIKGYIGFKPTPMFKLEMGLEMNVAMNDAKTVLFKEAKLVIEVDPKKPDESGVTISGKIEWIVRQDDKGDPVENIEFIGKIKAQITGGVDLDFQMVDMWRRPLGLSSFAFGNVKLSAGMNVRNPIMPSVEFGIEIWLGKIKSLPNTDDDAVEEGNKGEAKSPDLVRALITKKIKKMPKMIKVISTKRTAGTEDVETTEDGEVTGELEKELTDEEKKAKKEKEKKEEEEKKKEKEEKEKELNKHVIVAKGYFGIDPANPLNNYMYAEIGNLTMGKIAEAFELNVTNMSAPLKESGFPNGLTVSYTSSLEDKELTELEISIPTGVQIKGTINIFGLNLHADIQIDPASMNINGTVKMDPLNFLDGKILIQKSKEEEKLGPDCTFMIEKGSGNNKLEINGYAKLLGAEIETQILYEQSMVKFNVTATFFEAIRIELSFTGIFSKKLEETSFTFKGSLKTDMDKIVEMIDEVLKNIKEQANAANEKAKAELDASTAVQEEVEKIKNDWILELNQYKERLAAKAEDVKARKLKLKKECKCEDTCIPFFGWNPQCYKIWGAFVGCPTWVPCKWKVPDVMCYARCEIEQMGTKIMLWGEGIGIEIMMGLSDIGKVFIEQSSLFMKGYEALVKLAQGIMNLATKVVARGLAIAAKIAKTVLTNYIKINTLELSGEINPRSKSCANVDIDMELFTKKIIYKGEHCIGQNFVKGAAENVVDEGTKDIEDEKGVKVPDECPGTKKMNANLDEMEGQYSDVKKKKKDLNKEKEKLGKEIKTETRKKKKKKKRGGKRATVLTEKDMYYRRIYEEPVNYNHRSAATVRAFDTASPWNLMKNHDFDIQDSPLWTGSTDEMGSTRGLDSCSTVRHVIDKYDKLNDGFRAYTASAMDQQQNFQAAKKAYVQQLDGIKTQINDIESKKNMSNYDREDLYFWYNNVKKGIDDWTQNGERVVSDMSKRGIVAFKNQFDALVKRDKKVSVRSYIESIHVEGVAGVKRSTLPHPQVTQQSDQLHRVRKAVLDVYGEDGSSLHTLKDKVEKTSVEILSFKKIMHNCA